MVRLEVGRSYEARNGLRAEVLRCELDGYLDHIPYFVKYSDGAEYHLSKNGRVWQYSESSRDLIAERQDDPLRVQEYDAMSVANEALASRDRPVPRENTYMCEKHGEVKAMAKWGAGWQCSECAHEEMKEAVKAGINREPSEWLTTPTPDQPRSKYHRIIKGVELDIYDILVAWGVTCPARQHAIKKLFMAGERGAKGVVQDLDEAIQAVERAKELVG